MSDLQDKLDRGEITLDEYHERWLAEMAENERLHPGIHDRLFDHLMAKYPGPGIDADEFLLQSNRVRLVGKMYGRSNIPVTKSVEKQSWWDIETSRGRGLDSVTLYRGFYVEIDNSPDMDVIWLGINTGYDSVTYDYSEYPEGHPSECDQDRWFAARGSVDR